MGVVPDGGSCGIGGPVKARGSWFFPWLDEEKQQHGREREYECAANQRRGSSVDGIGNGISKNVKSPTKEGRAEKPGKAPECVHEPAAHHERLGRTHTRSVMNGPGAHSSILGSIPVRERWLRESQEIKVATDGRGIALLHNAP